MPVVDPPHARKSDLAAIHMAKASLRWTDDHYRDVMQAVCNVRSAAELDHAGRKRFLEHLRVCQGKAGIEPDRQARPARRQGKAWTPAHKRLWALWQQLADAGRVAQRDRAGLNAWVTSQVQVADIDWLTVQQLDQLIERAKAWLKR